MQILTLVITQCAYQATGISQIQITAFEAFSGWNQGVGANHDKVFHNSIIHDHGAHADQTIVTNLAGMQDGSMTNGVMVTHDQG